MYVVDLFGAFNRGREAAIEKNWKDLENYEHIEQMRNNNDALALNLLGARADFGGNRNIFQNQVDSSARANEVAEYAQPGMIARANLGSMFAQDQNATYENNRDLAQHVLNALFVTQLGEKNNAARAQQGKNDFLRRVAYGIGVNSGQDALNISNANNIMYRNQPTAAMQNNILSTQNFRANSSANNLRQRQINDAVALSSAIFRNNAYDAANYIPMRERQEAQAALATEAANKAAVENLIAQLISLAQAGDPGAAWRLRQLGLTPSGAPIQPQQGAATPAPTNKRSK